MKKQPSKAASSSRRRSRGDAQLREFEARDLGEDIRKAGTARVLRPRQVHATSIVLDEELVAQLREKGARRGLGYQTMLKLIVREHLAEY